mmetsp:Transcript_33751/g.108588  ORF Transcript_33751/g.108588 Transcript_33751/m.108588 type:complete len:205 (+) Transcript_33751:427-1041(+)
MLRRVDLLGRRGGARVCGVRHSLVARQPLAALPAALAAPGADRVFAALDRLLPLPTEPVRARRQAGRQGGGQGGGDRRARAAFLFRVGAVSGGRGGGRGGGRRCGGRVEAVGGNVGEAAGGDSEACCGRSERRVCAVVGGWRRRGRGEGCGGRGGGRSGHRPRDLVGEARQPGLSPPVRQPGLSPAVRGAVAPRVASADAGGPV